MAYSGCLRATEVQFLAFFSVLYVMALPGFEGLAIATSKSSKSLHRMLSIGGNPTMDKLTLILGVLRRELQVEIQVQAVACA